MKTLKFLSLILIFFSIRAQANTLVQESPINVQPHSIHYVWATKPVMHSFIQIEFNHSMVFSNESRSWSLRPRLAGYWVVAHSFRLARNINRNTAQVCVGTVMSSQGKLFVADCLLNADPKALLCEWVDPNKCVSDQSVQYLGDYFSVEKDDPSLVP